MFKTRLAVAIAAFLGLVGVAKSETMLLVQGYLASPANWRASGVAGALVTAGWQDAGHLSLGPAGVIAPPSPEGARRFYTLDLPTEAPVGEQARLVSAYVHAIAARDPGEKIVLVGHSAGGVAARMAMVVGRDPAVSALITIATPNLGSGLADAASAVSRSPVAWVAPLAGAGALNRSRLLYRDLGEESPWNLLGWLNRQPHPDARYVSVVRAGGDRVSEAWRQDLRLVPALGARAQAVVTPAAHGLVPADGRLVADLAAGFAAKP